MLEKCNKIYTSTFEKVYIIRFKSDSSVPVLSKEVLLELGKWYINTGIEWICHSKYSVNEFQKRFMEQSGLKQDDFTFEVDYLPFSR